MIEVVHVGRSLDAGCRSARCRSVTQATKTDVTRATLSHECATLSRATNSQTPCDCRVAHCDFVAQTNTASAPLFQFHDPPSQTQLRIVPYLNFSELFD